MRATSIVVVILLGVARAAPVQAADAAPMDHAAHMAAMADAQRQADVARRGKDVMPFDLAATVHVFQKTPDGGTQRVVSRDATDAKEVALVRAHLQALRDQFAKGDFSGPDHVHGHAMPGLADLKAAGPGRIGIDYREVDAGAELTYRSSDPGLVAALHRWFDAQLADHGADAMPGPVHVHEAPPGH